MFFCLLMLFVAGLLAIPVFTGKGKLMSTDNIIKSKIPTYKKWLRIMYAVMLVIVLLMAFFNFVEKVAYVETHYYEFVEDYVGKDETLHTAGESHTYNEMRDILIPAESTGSLCAPSESGPLPYKYTGTTYTLQEKFSFLGFIPYRTARILNFVGLGLAMVIVFGLFFFINRMTDKRSQQKNSRAAKRDPVRPSMPRGAFDFSDYKDEVEVKDDMFDGVTQDIPSKRKKN